MQLKINLKETYSIVQKYTKQTQDTLMETTSWTLEKLMECSLKKSDLTTNLLQQGPAGLAQGLRLDFANFFE